MKPEEIRPLHHLRGFKVLARLPGIPVAEPVAGRRLPAYPGDLDVVQLLLPVQNRLHAIHPHVNVANQHRLADSLDQCAQRRVEGLQ